LATTKVHAAEDSKRPGKSGLRGTGTLSTSSRFTIPGVKRSAGLKVRNVNSTTLKPSKQTEGESPKKKGERVVDSSIAEEFNAKRKGLVRAKELGLLEKKKASSKSLHTNALSHGIYVVNSTVPNATVPTHQAPNNENHNLLYDGDYDETGYLIERTRTNTDCTGKVMAIAVLLTGVTTYIDKVGIRYRGNDQDDRNDDDRQNRDDDYYSSRNDDDEKKRTKG